MVVGGGGGGSRGGSRVIMLCEGVVGVAKIALIYKLVGNSFIILTTLITVIPLPIHEYQVCQYTKHW